MDDKRIAIITGGAGGIGSRTAEKLTADGCTVVIADTNTESGAAVAEQYNGLFVETDLARRDDCRQLVDETIDTFGRVDILINNAGFQHIAPIEQFPEDKWDDLITVMLTAPFLLTRYAWPSMKQHGWGRIVNMSSIHGKVASPFKAAYVSAKHGLIGLTRTCALEGGEFGITVNAVCPTYVRTPLVESQIADQARVRNIPPDQVISQVMLEPAAIKRPVEPEEVAALIAYLCSDVAAMITGEAISIDAGWTAR